MGHECDTNEFLEFLHSNMVKRTRKWKHRFTTNCYAFALGLDVREGKVMPCAYIPGNIGSSQEKIEYKHIFTYQNLITNIYDDLVYMRIKFREIDPMEIVDEDEWKIALFTTMLAYEDYVEYLSDFHFLREGEDGTWYHKLGWLRGVRNKDFHGDIITDPRKCVIKNSEYRMSLALKLK